MRVGIAAYGQTEFAKNDKKIIDVLMEATKKVFDNAENVSQNDIDAVLVSTNNNEKYLSSILSEMVGIKPKISHTVENLCNSGTNTIVSGYSYIKSGLADVVLISGAERFDSPGQVLEWDNSRGEFKHPIFWASIFSKSYKRHYSVTDEDLAIVSVKNHDYAQNNPFALSKKTCTVEDVLNSKKLTEDIRLLNCSRPCTGGASILLASEQMCKKITDSPVWISGIGQKTISAGFTKNNEYHLMTSTKDAANNAYNMAKINPKDIDVAEVHDAFSVCEPMSIEALGISIQGKGMQKIKELYESGDKKINPRGGLIGSGHPLGATGIAQTIEITQQLQSKAENRQTDNPQTGIIHNMSAAATSSTVIILQK